MKQLPVALGSPFDVLVIFLVGSSQTFSVIPKMQQDHQSVGWQKGTLMLEGVVDSK